MLCKYTATFAVAALAALFVANTVSNASAAGEKAVAKVGAAAPAFTLNDQNGKSVSLADFSGKIVVLEWFNNECPYVVKHYSGGHMNELAKKYADKGVVWLAVNSTKGKTTETNKAIATEWKMDRAVLSDANGATGHAYGAKTTPNMYVVNKDGTLAYAGAIDDKSSTDAGDISGSTNYVAKALDELLAGKPVSTPETKPYGCSVKYAK